MKIAWGKWGGEVINFFVTYLERGGGGEKIIFETVVGGWSLKFCAIVRGPKVVTVKKIVIIFKSSFCYRFTIKRVYAAEIQRINILILLCILHFKLVLNVLQVILYTK